ncbi:hypothetical protein [Sphingomonas crocodyli]|uniref:Uncharacterized protein n=1 Tax=Sphingomonas crocodyli TaxID=1979270 RepID=A0A437LXR6_9SPHN|nr:hypothetical protein [Sphingomonas crocodyli]RVT90205.1 hypothetical protein EOD43_18075 [Sphingomonas crocodyli]
MSFSPLMERYSEAQAATKLARLAEEQANIRKRGDDLRMRLRKLALRREEGRAQASRNDT